MTLTEWRKLSFQLAADLQTLRREALRSGHDTLAEDAAALRARVEERRFTVAVVGDFRRGKSTFLNALLGRAILPSDVAPTTATVNRVTWGTRPGAELRFHDGRPAQAIPIGELAEHVTKLTGDAAARAAEIREAVVTWPVSFCRNDVDLLDTPGLGDEATMTAVTLRQLPHVDAAILVVMADSPFSETEGEFLDRLYAEGVTELLFVVSALDRIRRPADRERVVASIRDRIATRIRRIADTRFPTGGADHAAFLARRGDPRVFGVSALTALEARQAESAETADAVEASGMPAFEAALERFLTGADEVALRRRFEQAEALGRQFAAPEAATPDASAEAELVRLAALVHALEGVVDDHRRRVGDAYARTVATMSEVIERFGPRARQVVAHDLQTISVAPHFPARYGAFLDELAGRLSESIRGVARLFGPEIERRLLEETGEQEAEEKRILAAVAYVLDYVETTLRGLGHGLPGPLWLAPDADPVPTFDTEGLAAALAPPPAALRAAMDDLAIEATLHQLTRRSALDALLAFDFAGVQGRWAALQLPRVVGVCEAWWARYPAAAVVRERLDHVARRRLARLDPVSRALRSVLAEIVACRERSAMGRERRAHDHAASLRTARELADGFHAAAARLAGE